MFTVDEVAKLVGGKVIGDGKLRIKGMSRYDFAEEGDMTFAFDEKEFEHVGKSKASCVLTMVGVENYPKTILRVDNIKLAMTVLYNALFNVKIPEKGAIHPTAVISETAELGENVSIGPYAVIGNNTRIGANTIISAQCVISENVCIGEKSCLYPGVTVYNRVIIGNGVVIHSGAIIGADGFGYITKDEKIYKVPQLGGVIIEDGVEIGANSCVDKGTFDTTVIGKETKIDNLVQIAHNVKIGSNVLIAALTGIGGSTTVGDNTMMGGMVGVSDHVRVGKNVKIGAKTGVHGHVKDDRTIFGYPFREAADAKMQYALMTLLSKHGRKFRKFLRELPEVE